MLLAPDGEVWVEREDIRGTRLLKGIGSEAEFLGRTYVSLSSIDGLDYSIDMQTVTIEVMAAPRLFEAQSVDASFRRDYEVLSPKDNSAFLNYGLVYDAGNSAYNLSTELGLRAGDYMALSTFNYGGGTGEGFVRLMTSVTTDSVGAMRTVVAGDFTARSGLLGTGVLMGGINVSRNFRTSPHFIAYPNLSLTGSIETPSEVEVYVNGHMVSSRRLLPGEFRFDNISAEVGPGVSEILIRDIYGNERRISRPFYYTDRLLKKGLHEYNYSIGLLRDDFAKESFSYRELSFVSLHNYGFSDTLKGGYSLELSGETINAGPTVSALLSRAGVLEGALNVSSSGGRTGYGAHMGYFFRSRPVNTALSFSYTSEDYANVGLEPLSGRPSVLSSSVGLSRRGWGSLSLEYSRINEAASGVTRYGLAYNRPLTRKIGFFLIARQSGEETGRRLNSVFLNFHFNLTDSVSGSLSYQNDEYGGAVRGGIRRNMPAGTGYAFNADVTTRSEGTDIMGALRGQTGYGVYGLAYSRMGEEENHILTASGGIGYIDGGLFLSRPITDSFGKVRVGENRDVRVYYFGNEAGRTDFKGEFVIPNLMSFEDNRVGIESRDIPVNYSIGKVSLYVSPMFRSGAVIDFGVKRIQGFTGRVYIGEEDGRRPLEYVAVRVRHEGGELEGMVGRKGELYIENLPPGIQTATIDYEGETYSFELDVPRTDEIYVDLGEIVLGPPETQPAPRPQPPETPGEAPPPDGARSDVEQTGEGAPPDVARATGLSFEGEILSDVPITELPFEVREPSQEETGAGPVPAVERGFVYREFRHYEAMVGTVHFLEGAKVIRREDDALLRKVFRLLDYNRILRADIEGYADDVGTESYNMKLGLERALMVGKRLLDMGLPEWKLHGVRSYGESRQLCATRDAACRRRNQRVVIRLVLVDTEEAAGSPMKARPHMGRSGRP